MKVLCCGVVVLLSCIGAAFSSGVHFSTADGGSFSFNGLTVEFREESLRRDLRSALGPEDRIYVDARKDEHLFWDQLGIAFWPTYQGDWQPSISFSGEKATAKSRRYKVENAYTGKILIDGREFFSLNQDDLVALGFVPTACTWTDPVMQWIWMGDDFLISLETRRKTKKIIRKGVSIGGPRKRNSLWFRCQATKDLVTMDYLDRGRMMFDELVDEGAFSSSPEKQIEVASLLERRLRRSGDAEGSDRYKKMIDQIAATFVDNPAVSSRQLYAVALALGRCEHATAVPILDHYINLAKRKRPSIRYDYRTFNAFQWRDSLSGGEKSVAYALELYGELCRDDYQQYVSGLVFLERRVFALEKVFDSYVRVHKYGMAAPLAG